MSDCVLYTVRYNDGRGITEKTYKNWKNAARKMKVLRSNPDVTFIWICEDAYINGVYYPSILVSWKESDDNYYIGFSDYVSIPAILKCL